MKKYIVLFVFAVAVFAVLPASAQNQIGVISGVNLASIGSDDLENALGAKISSLFATGFGGVIDLGIAQNLVLHLEPMYVQKGAKLEAGNEEAKIKLSYIDMPVLFKLLLGAGTTRPYLMAGPTVGLKVGASFENIIGLESDDVKGLDLGLGFGAGVSFPLGAKALFIEGRYTLGLSNIADNSDGGEVSVKNKGIQFMAGVAFPLGK